MPTVRPTLSSTAEMKDEFGPSSSLEIAATTRVGELKQIIATLDTLVTMGIAPSLLRVREVAGKVMGRLLHDDTLSLQKCKVADGSTLSVTILSQPDTLTPSSLLLHVGRRVPRTRIVEHVRLVAFDDGLQPSLPKLRSALCHALQLTPAESEAVEIAKYFKSQRTWVVLEEEGAKSGGGARRGRRKGPANAPLNLRNAPVSLKDGDFLAVKVLADDPSGKDDFGLKEEDEDGLVMVVPKAGGKARRPEPKLSIHVPTFQ